MTKTQDPKVGHVRRESCAEVFTPGVSKKSKLCIEACFPLLSRNIQWQARRSKIEVMCTHCGGGEVSSHR